jgi:Bifunctional DNA primase/polymerase, N-terminal
MLSPARSILLLRVVTPYFRAGATNIRRRKTDSVTLQTTRRRCVSCGGDIPARLSVSLAPSRMAVLDIDAKHPGSHFWWKANRARLISTRVHRTRSRGLHLVYLHCEGLKCSAGKIAPGVDVRGEGGYAVWWPADGLPVLSDAPIASWPEWLSEILARPLRPPPMLHWSARIVSPSFIETRIEAVLRFVFDAPIRERNSRLYWAACRVIEMIRGDDLDCVTGDQALDELRQIGAAVGLSDREVVLTITSATRGRGI